MIRYLACRLASSLLVLLLLSLVVFSMVRLIPGDPTAAFVDPANPDPAAVAQIRAQLGLDRPFAVQYFSWLGDLLHGNLGDADYGGPRPAVQDVSLRVRRGEIVGVIGESGSGKSSLAYAAMGLLPAAARVRARALEVAGQDVVGLDEKGWCAVRGAGASMVFQEPMTALNPCQRVGRQIGEVLRIHGGLDPRAADARAIELLELVRMPEPQRRARYFPHQLSGGQHQRVVIAIAVAAAPCRSDGGVLRRDDITDRSRCPRRTSWRSGSVSCPVDPPAAG